MYKSLYKNIILIVSLVYIVEVKIVLKYPPVYLYINNVYQNLKKMFTLNNDLSPSLLTFI